MYHKCQLNTGERLLWRIFFERLDLAGLSLSRKTKFGPIQSVMVDPS